MASERQTTLCENCIDPTDCPTLGCAHELFGGEAPPIIRTAEDEAYLARHLAYVARHGHQP